MFSSTNELNGFSAVGQEEMEKVNGGDLLASFLIGGVIGAAAVGITYGVQAIITNASRK